MQTGGGCGDRPTLLRIHGLITLTIVVASSAAIDVRRQWRLANSIDYVIEIPVSLELNQSHTALHGAGDTGLQKTVGKFDLVADPQTSSGSSQCFPDVAIH